MPRDPAVIRANLPLIGGRLSVAIDEVIRLIDEDLPGVIDSHNAEFGVQIPKPARKVRIAPSDLDSVDLDEILIEYSTRKEIRGPGLYTSFTTLYVHSIDDRIVQGRQVQQISDRGDLIAAVLFVGDAADWSNPDGLRVWSNLTQSEQGPLPGEWKQYNGTTLTYLLVQAMNDGWV